MRRSDSPRSDTFAWMHEHLVHAAIGSGALEPLVQTLADCIVTQGLAPLRLSLSVLTLHPSLAGLGIVWHAGDGTVGRHARPWGFLETDEHRSSPLHVVMTTRQTLRVRLERGEGAAFAILRDFRQAGATDYVALPIPSLRGDVHVLALSTSRPGGFSDQDLEGLHTLVPVLSLAVETFESRRLARIIVETYLGPRTGPRVLAGQIHRGASERIPAAVWFSDLRSFTSLTRVLGDEGTVQALNGWFELAVGSIQEHGGEVLKFIGDALLAIFPVQDDGWRDAVDMAVAAAQQIHRAEFAHGRLDGQILESGVAIHTGDVLYGNVGAPGRLDFTVLGSAVNTAARVSGLCATLGEPLVLSGRAAVCCSSPLRALGAHPVKGFPDPVDLFAIGG
jgi:adenylate cyclase